ncbi:DUF6279 family lipoprotein [Hydrogenophaga sp. NFH-34]|uniref:DUF6279 family lipoprotein n=1 Tax=Hydrogenophaga sp. NFH-34 TaxID=2744446 RepID=UPI001F40122C|nr:DUF6279 family lipoprotein [Hydrogenophaga sp. NFH-34]
MNTSYGAPMHPFAIVGRIIAPPLAAARRLLTRWRLAALLLAALALTGCSVLRLAYSQAPAALYWWVDGYVDLNDAQSAALRQDIDRFAAWHRQDELPAYIGLLGTWQAMAPQNTTGAQSCAQYGALRAAVVRLADQGAEPLARVALQLSPAQLQHLERHHAKRNREFEKDFLRGTPTQRLQRRVDKAVDRYEMLYGRLSPEQVAQVRQGLRDAPFDAERLLAERRARQDELLRLIRQLQAAQGGPLANGAAVPAPAVAALRDWFVRGLPQADDPGAPWIAHGCAEYAALHNRTSAAQRERAVQVLKGYEADLRALAAPA